MNKTQNKWTEEWIAAENYWIVKYHSDSRNTSQNILMMTGRCFFRQILFVAVWEKRKKGGGGRDKYLFSIFSCHSF